MKILSFFRVTVFRVIVFSFAAAIAAGTLLLMLPFSGGADWMTALFTATSAVCVTGLVVVPTYSFWTPFGKFVIWMLIQVGGMGVISISIMMVVMSGKKVSLKQRTLMESAISADQIGGVVPLTWFAVKLMIIIELIGALLLSFPFVKDYGFRGIFYALFHSASAFCNAGFDLIGDTSLAPYGHRVDVLLPVMLLIISGGLGFKTWNDIVKNRTHFREYALSSKISLVTTAFLIGVGAVLMFPDIGDSHRALSSLFQSVTCRTAGFSSFDFKFMGERAVMVSIMLMLIGGGTGSTAGGMKTSTLAVLFASTIAVFRGKEDVSLFQRRIRTKVVRTALAVFFLYIVVTFTAATMISFYDGVDILTSLFECASAIGTVGLTLGITPTLGIFSRWILIALMLFGRVGGLTFLFAAYQTKPSLLRYPEEQLSVG